MIDFVHRFTMRRTVGAALVSLSALLGSVGGGLPAALAATTPPPVSDQVFLVGYNRIAEIYLQPVDMAKLGVDGLSGLTSLDPLFKAERLGASVHILWAGRPVYDFAVPDGDAANAWAVLTARAIDRVRQVSPVLREATTEQLYQAVFDGLMVDLDPYSRYTTAQRATTERAVREGYGGLGLAVEQTGTRYTIRDVNARGPAQRAGIQAGDAIDRIDGTPTRQLTLQEVRDALRGPPGSTLHLSVITSRGTERRLAVQRERVIPNTVQSRIDNNVGILKVERFNAATATNLREAITLIQGSLGPNAVGFVLDLRGNPGGLLDQAVAVANLFIRRGRIVSTAGRHPDSWQRFEAAGEDILHEKPLAVLIDGRSASASEIVAAALQDSGRAVLVGASSFGKGSVQTVTRLPNDGELFLTWSRIYAPSGYTLHRQGVQPTVCTSRDNQDVDAVLAPLRTGQTEPPNALARWKALAPDDEMALAHLRQSCPWKTHEPELDVRVAERLLSLGPLYRSALAGSTTAVAER